MHGSMPRVTMSPLDYYTWAISFFFFFFLLGGLFITPGLLMDHKYAIWCTKIDIAI